MISFTLVLIAASVGIIGAVLVGGMVLARGEDRQLLSGNVASGGSGDPPPDKAPAFEATRAIRHQLSAQYPDVDDDRR